MGGAICCGFDTGQPLLLGQEDEEEVHHRRLSQCETRAAEQKRKLGSATLCRPPPSSSGASATRCPILPATQLPPPPPPPRRRQALPTRQTQRQQQPWSFLRHILPRLPPRPQPQQSRLPSSAPRLPAATSKALTVGRRQDPIGCMFCPELNNAGVLGVISEVLCAPGFVSGPSEGKRLLRSVRSGRVDICTMARLLRWLRGERAARELRDRGVKFVGPDTEQGLPPITTGLGMTGLTEELIACGHKAGTKFVICFSSCYEACSGVISGVLTESPSVPRIEPDSMPEPKCDFTRESIYESNQEEESKGESSSASSGGRHRGSRCLKKKPTGASTPSPLSSQAAWTASSGNGDHGIGGVGVGGGDGSGLAQCPGRLTPNPSRTERTPSHNGGGAGSNGSNNRSKAAKDYSRTDVVAHLFDEIPTHCRGGGGGGSGGGGDGGGGGDWNDGRVYAAGENLFKMEVGQWAKYYGECVGPLLAAWIFPDESAPRPSEAE